MLTKSGSTSPSRQKVLICPHLIANKVGHCLFQHTFADLSWQFLGLASDKLFAAWPFFCRFGDRLKCFKISEKMPSTMSASSRLKFLNSWSWRKPSKMENVASLSFHCLPSVYERHINSCIGLTNKKGQFHFEYQKTDFPTWLCTEAFLGKTAHFCQCKLLLGHTLKVSP